MQNTRIELAEIAKLLKLMNYKINNISRAESVGKQEIVEEQYQLLREYTIEVFKLLKIQITEIK